MIYFHSIANSKWGLGNYSRCKTIADALLEHGVTVELLIETNSTLKLHLLNENTKLFVNRKELLAYLDRIVEDKITENNVLITDLPNLDGETISKYKNIKFDKIISINDAKIDELRPDIFINQDEVAIIQNKDIQQYRGPKYQSIRKEFNCYRMQSPQYINKIKKIGFVYGGADPALLIEATITQIVKNDTEFEGHFVIGPGVSTDRAERIKKLTNNKIFVEQNPNIPKFVMNMDAIVTMGGITSYEAMYLSKPVFAVEWSYMSKYVRYLEEKKLLISLGEPAEIVLNLKKAVLDVNKINDRIRNSHQLIDGRAINRIADIILKLC